MGMYNFLTQNYIGPHTKYCYLVHSCATNINLTIMLCNVNFTFSFILIYLLLGLRSRYSQLIQRIKVKTVIFLLKLFINIFFSNFQYSHAQ